MGVGGGALKGKQEAIAAATETLGPPSLDGGSGSVKGQKTTVREEGGADGISTPFSS